ncbi:hypothetical protein HCH_01688 [Hahella chejuensis KCTC 2396]|uniref:Uncharacterized protein n=1 Tax=Hahella chejuensis (strain KCTC 2396) TaxID=349521 RepID=Q2SLD5_HAHCH|nr:hypothetical protein HCH_01688 [Hahella chejuensis KCTC 2396]
MTPEILRLTFLTHKKAADGRLCACRQRPIALYNINDVN